MVGAGEGVGKKNKKGNPDDDLARCVEGDGRCRGTLRRVPPRRFRLFYVHHVLPHHWLDFESRRLCHDISDYFTPWSWFQPLFVFFFPTRGTGGQGIKGDGCQRGRTTLSPLMCVQFVWSGGGTDYTSPTFRLIVRSDSSFALFKLYAASRHAWRLVLGGGDER